MHCSMYNEFQLDFTPEKELLYWVRLKGYYMVARFSANFSKNCSEADSAVGGHGAAEENSKPFKPFSPTQ